MITRPDHKLHCETAIVVLGHQMSKDGVPDEVGLKRLEIAATEMRKRPGAILVTSGWAYRDDTDLSLADAMANASIRLHGTANEDIVRLHDSRDTVGDAVFFARNVRPRFVNVVTSEYHRARAERIFGFILGNDAQLRVVGVDDTVEADIEQTEAASQAAFEDTFRDVEPGDLDGIYRRMKSDHPYYNGAQDAKAARRHD
ncbi:MAG: YdcF family protein [Boseongicola sp.]